MIGKTKILGLAVAALLLVAPSVTRAACVSGSGKLTKLARVENQLKLVFDGTTTIYVPLDETVEDKGIVAALLMVLENPDGFTVSVTNGNNGSSCINSPEVSVEPK